jgi:NADP-dependent aldehyde dehydrogenase
MVETMKQVSGSMLIGGRAVYGQNGSTKAFDPALGQELEPSFGFGGIEEVNEACELAAAAFDPYRAASLETRTGLLETIANNLLELGSVLVDRAVAESGLPRPRIEGELARTVGQLRLFADEIREGSWLQARLDSALPDRQPMPRPDLRLSMVPLGPVAVFGASNFPLAFSVAGGDTASALAAGCPVIVKAHNAHLGTSELVGRAIQAAVQACGLPAGVFSLLIGEGNEIGQALARHPAVCAIGFTGSRQGGTALMRTAAERPVPIPVYAEMSSINPVFLLPHAAEVRAETLAQGFVDSLTLGVGQFCTNPGLVLACEGSGLERFRSAAVSALQAKQAATMLTQGIHRAYVSKVDILQQHPAVRQVGSGLASSDSCRGQAVLFETTAEAFCEDENLAAEVFGPSSLLVVCRSVEQMRMLAERLEGQLTATLLMEQADLDAARSLLPVLERRVGRILVNGFPTGVEVCHAMVHGGPYPATSDSRSTSVGSLAISRFLRPVCYQGFPAELLPLHLADANPFALRRRKDGVFA